MGIGTVEDTGSTSTDEIEATDDTASDTASDIEPWDLIDTMNWIRQIEDTGINEPDGAASVNSKHNVNQYHMMIR
ncbi:hypothetical protein PHMEG_00036936 [Phytophthora megakarya]|uniref:Uncharacterized protein n=1 Tax=Phytophthora megakarya TaxID=4795 RepID=A0A225UKQ5_9STRA|nr:hypothetical protein PHMEG_00036936 [Phytophthora megakarya]